MFWVVFPCFSTDRMILYMTLYVKNGIAVIESVIPWAIVRVAPAVVSVHNANALASHRRHGYESESGLLA